MIVKEYITDTGKRARTASRLMARASTGDKNAALTCIANIILDSSNDLIAANAIDMKKAKDNIDAAMLDRLELTPATIASMADGLQQIAALPDQMLQPTPRDCV